MTLIRAASAIPDSLLARWDGRWKLASLFGLGLVASFLTTPIAAAAMLIVATALLAVSRLKGRSVLVVVSVLLLGVMPLAVAMPLLSPAGWLPSLVLVLRSLAVGLIVFAAVATAPPHQTFAALAGWGMPKRMVLLLQFTYRYAVMLAGEARRVRVAMAVRGFRIRPTIRTYTGFGNLIGSILVRSGERAETVTHAMKARGFDGTYRSLISFQTTRGDVLGFVLVVIIALAVIGIEAWARG